MKDILQRWILYNQVSGEYSEMFRDEGEEELCIEDNDTIYTINDEHVVYSRDEAEKLAQLIWDGFLQSLDVFDDLAADQPLVKVVTFRHGGNDWARALSAEWSVSVNRLGYGVVVRRDLLERLRIPYFKASSVIGHTGGDNNSGDPESPPTSGNDKHRCDNPDCNSFKFYKEDKGKFRCKQCDTLQE